MGSTDTGMGRKRRGQAATAPPPTPPSPEDEEKRRVQQEEWDARRRREGAFNDAETKRREDEARHAARSQEPLALIHGVVKSVELKSGQYMGQGAVVFTLDTNAGVRPQHDTVYADEFRKPVALVVPVGQKDSDRQGSFRVGTRIVMSVVALPPEEPWPTFKDIPQAPAADPGPLAPFLIDARDVGASDAFDGHLARVVGVLVADCVTLGDVAVPCVTAVVSAAASLLLAVCDPIREENVLRIVRDISARDRHGLVVDMLDRLGTILHIRQLLRRTSGTDRTALPSLRTAVEAMAAAAIASLTAPRSRA